MFGIQRLNAATNILLAKNTLDYIELVPENPISRQLRDSIVTALRTEVDANVADPVFELMFNGWTSTRKLLVVAEAFDRLVIPPMITPEVWCRVKNPFDPKMESEKHQSAVSQRLRKTYGVSITIEDSHLFLSQSGLFDERLPFEPQVSPLPAYLLSVLQRSLSEPENAHIALQAPGGLTEAAKLLQQLMQASYLMYLGQCRRFSSYHDYYRAMVEGDDMFIASSFTAGNAIGIELQGWCIWQAWNAFRSGIGEAEALAFFDRPFDRWHSASAPKLAELEKRFLEQQRGG